MTQRPRLTVLGTGYLGATHAVCMADLGYKVLAVDHDPGKIAKLADGELPFYEPGLDAMLVRALASGRLRFTTDPAEAGAFGDVHFICVGTPQRVDSLAADTTYLHQAVKDLIPHLTAGSLVVGKSTVPVGTAGIVAKTLREQAPDALLAWNPEFLREGFAVNDTLRPDRLVFGVEDEMSLQLLEDAYSGVFALAEQESREIPTVVCNFATAELAKSAANAFLATKISFINAMAELCEATGANVVPLAEALGHDVRIGASFLRAGIGFGGGCLPKDVRALGARAREVGVKSLDFLSDVDAINQRRRIRAVDLASEILGDGTKVAILGATFKPGTDDVRDSPALEIASRLVNKGINVSIYDPVGMENARSALPSAEYALSPVEAATGADLVMVLTEWDDFAALNPTLLGNVVQHRQLIDGRGCLDEELWRTAGWNVRTLGRGDRLPFVCKVRSIEPV